MKLDRATGGRRERRASPPPEARSGKTASRLSQPLAKSTKRDSLSQGGDEPSLAAFAVGIATVNLA
jgi:hypothetical protein